MEPNEDLIPSFRVEFGWDQETPTRLRVGVFNRALPQPVFTTAPIETPRKQAYTIARTFVTWVNGVLKPGWICEFNQQRLYLDHSHATAMHMYSLRVEEDLETKVCNLSESQLTRLTAELKAKQLLQNLHPDIFIKVERGGSFYIQSTRHVYICNVDSRRLWVLLPQGPKSLCVYLQDSSVQQNKYDWVIGMYRYLMGAEQTLLKTANHFDFWLSENEEVKIAEDQTQEKG